MKKKYLKIAATVTGLLAAATITYPVNAETDMLDLSAMIADAAGWYGETMIYDDFIMGPNYMELKKGHTKIVCYGNYDNFDLVFKTKVQYDENKEDFCYGLTFHDQDGNTAMWDPAKAACYSLVFYNTDISLNRVIGGVKTEIKLVSGYLNDNMEEHAYLLSVRDEDEGIRIQMTRDDKLIMDVVDKENPIIGSGPITFTQDERRDVILYGSEQPQYISQSTNPVEISSSVPTEKPIQPATVDEVEAARIAAPVEKIFYNDRSEPLLWIAVGCCGVILLYAAVVTVLYIKSRRKNKRR